MWRQPWFLSSLGQVLGSSVSPRTRRRTHPSPVGGPAVCGEVISLGTSTGSRCWPCFRLWNTSPRPKRSPGVSRTDNTAVVSYIKPPRRSEGRVTCTGWRTRSLCGPRENSSHSEQLHTWASQRGGRTPCRDRGLCPGNGCFTPRWWSRYGARLRWTSSLLRRQSNVPSGTLYFIQPHWVWSSPPPGDVEVLGVAPDGAQLVASGLINRGCWDRTTPIQSSLSEETVRLEVGTFTSWWRRLPASTQSTARFGTVLEFVQACSSTGLTHSTLKVTDGNSAYHTSLGEQSVGNHPLGTHFLHSCVYGRWASSQKRGTVRLEV